VDASQQLGWLMDLADQFGVSIRRAPAGEAGGRSGGAVVRLKGKQIVFLDSSSSVADQTAVLAAALAGRPELNDRFLPPEIRELIDSAGQREL